MAQTPEKLVKNRIDAILKELGVWYFKPSANGYGRSSIPDFIGCLEGGFIAIEAKAKGNKPTVLQAREIERIKAAGGFAKVINEENVDGLKADLEEWSKKDWIL